MPVRRLQVAPPLRDSSLQLASGTAKREKERDGDGGERNPRSRRLAFIRFRLAASAPPLRFGEEELHGFAPLAAAEASAPGARGKASRSRGGAAGLAWWLRWVRRRVLGEFARSLAAALRIELLRPLNRGS